MNTVTTAVILAAGRGIRLQSVTTAIPKGFLKFGDRTIIEESIEKLQRAGIRDVVIVTGHLADRFEELKRSQVFNVELIHNKAYDSTGTLASLLCASSFLSSDFLLLESDLVFEGRLIDGLVSSTLPDLLALSGWTGGRDEVYVEVQGDRVLGISKQKALLGDCVRGEYIGIARLSGQVLDLLSELALSNKPQSLKWDYVEEGLRRIVQTWPIRYLYVEDLKWGEIDDEWQYQRVKHEVYPAIRARECNRPIPVS